MSSPFDTCGQQTLASEDNQSQQAHEPGPDGSLHDDGASPRSGLVGEFSWQGRCSLDDKNEVLASNRKNNQDSEFWPACYNTTQAGTRKILFTWIDAH